MNTFSAPIETADNIIGIKTPKGISFFRWLPGANPYLDQLQIECSTSESSKRAATFFEIILTAIIANANNTAIPKYVKSAFSKGLKLITREAIKIAIIIWSTSVCFILVAIRIFI